MVLKSEGMTNVCLEEKSRGRRWDLRIWFLMCSSRRALQTSKGRGEEGAGGANLDLRDKLFVDCHPLDGM